MIGEGVEAMLGEGGMETPQYAHLQQTAREGKRGTLDPWYADLPQSDWGCRAQTTGVPTNVNSKGGFGGSPEFYSIRRRWDLGKTINLHSFNPDFEVHPQGDPAIPDHCHHR